MRTLAALVILTGIHVSVCQTQAQENKIRRVGYEILQIKSFNEIVAWASKDITREQFDALKLPLGWFKNQPREVEMDGARFLNSPGRTEGSYSRARHFGHEWLHVATVKMAERKRFGPKGLLVGSKVIKDHVITFDEGSSAILLVSPDGKIFPRITRDANRTREQPTLPDKWRLIEHKFDRPTELRLTGETMVIRSDNQDSFQGPVEFSFDKLHPQEKQQTPSPRQASLLFLMLDQDGDRKVSRDEAKGDLKENFAFVDSNKDGGIDLNELTRVLKLASGQRATGDGGNTAGASAANFAQPSYGTRNEKQWARMRSVSPDEDHEFLMVNLIKYRARAQYADGRQTDLTGKQANALYAPINFIAQIGGKVNFVGQVSEQMGNIEPHWDEVAIVRYPSRSGFFKMVTNPEFQKRAVHKDAGLEVSQVLLTEPMSWTLSGTKRVPDKEDAFTLAQLIKYQNTVKGSEVRREKQQRTGMQAMDAFDTAIEHILREVGAKRLLRTRVEGALIGDGRTWDEFRLLHFPSEAAYTAYSDAVQQMFDAVKQLNRVIEDSYAMKVEPMPFARRLAISLATSFLGQQGATLNEPVNTPPVRPGVYRTPESRFAGIDDFPFKRGNEFSKLLLRLIGKER